MPVYILLSTLTVQGVQTLKSNPDRLRAVNQDVEELGCKVLHHWATPGEFDFVYPILLLTYLLVHRDNGQQRTGPPMSPAAAFYVRLLRQLEPVSHPDEAD